MAKATNRRIPAQNARRSGASLPPDVARAEARGVLKASARSRPAGTAGDILRYFLALEIPPAGPGNQD